MNALITKWSERPGGPTDCGVFLKALVCPKRNIKDKLIILKSLNDWNILVNIWFEVADHVPVLTTLASNENFLHRKDTSLLISKVYHCLEDYERSLSFALEAEEAFDVGVTGKTSGDNEYINKVLETALDNYKKKKRSLSASPIDPKLEKLVDKLVARNLEKGEHWYIIALGFELKRLDIIQLAIDGAAKDLNSKRIQAVLCETVKRALAEDIDENSRKTITSIVIRKLYTASAVDFSRLCEFFLTADMCMEVADFILISVDADRVLMAYQLAFDVFEFASQRQLKDIVTAMKLKKPQPAEKIAEKLYSILRGEDTVRLYKNFLIKNNHTDSNLLEEYRDSVRNAMGHNAILICNGLLSYGTNSDIFLRNNLPYVSKATNWNKFNTVASLGLIHYGQQDAALRLLDPYLPRGGTADSFGFKEGGAMLAYGLVSAGHGNLGTIRTLEDWIKTSPNPQQKHGACLGYAVASLGSNDKPAYFNLRQVLMEDDAVTGEGAAIGMGLLAAGQLYENLFNEMINYSKDTSHDKIQRGIRTALGCAAFGVRETVLPYTEQIINQKTNPVLRSTGVIMLAMAYAGTSDCNVVSQLLNKIASDPNVDVKRYASIGIGFVLCNDPENCISYVKMLYEHYNPHVRYGCAMALALACASTAHPEALDMLATLIKDKEGFVRNMAVISQAIICSQQSEQICPAAVKFRKLLLTKISEKNEEPIVKMGCIIAHGLMDAGGQNASVRVLKPNGEPDMAACVGMLCFAHSWYWHSMYLFASLALKPNTLILVNKDLKMPLIDVASTETESKFGYYPKREQKREKENQKVETAVLSISSKKSSARRDKPAPLSVSARVQKKSSSRAPSEPRTPKPDPKPALLHNPLRVINKQNKTLYFPPGTNYMVMKPLSRGGIVVCHNTDSAVSEKTVTEVTLASSIPRVDNKERVAPKPFEFDLKNY